MCGIAGFFVQRVVAPEAALAMQNALRARGPDAQHAIGWDRQLMRTDGAWHNGLVHTRLAIIDPRPEADQPMRNDQGDIWIAYNGEVYDTDDAVKRLETAGARFRTRSDTEIILRGYEAWGITELLERLRGMFAFAIVDLAKKKVFLARDRMGEKPLVYTFLNEELVFGSLVRAVLPFLSRGDRAFSEAGIDAYLAHRYIPAPRTIFRNVQRLENGHYLEFDLATRKFAKYRYWQPTPHVAPWQEALDDAVRMRTRSDRPLGLFLSGGVDSTIIASRLVQQRFTEFGTFTASFPGSKMNESLTAEETASTLGLRHTRVVIPAVISEEFDRIVADLDEPFADPSSIPTWCLARAVSGSVKVVLAGDGGDELFGGYKRVAKHLRTRWRRPWRLPLAIRAGMEKRSGILRTEMAMDWASAYSLRFSGFTPPQRAYFQPERPLSQLTYWREPDVAGATAVEQLLAVDYANYLPEYILRKSDLCTMAHGLESRAPLLDHEFVRRIFALPLKERLTHPSKIVMQPCMDSRVSGTVFSRKKKGFNPPLHRWLRADLGPRLCGLGERLQALTSTQVSAFAVDAFVQRYLEGAEQGAEQVLQLLMLETSLSQLVAL